MKTLCTFLLLFAATAAAQSFSGIGVALAPADDGFKVNLIVDNGPASRSKLKVNDIITAVAQVEGDAVPLKGKSLSETVKLIKGPIGTRVRLTVNRAGEAEPMIIPITRQTIQNLSTLPEPVGKQPKVGDVMEMKFTDLDGKEVDLAAMKGKVVLVDFWATWCGPCIRELPNVKRVYEAEHKNGFEVIGISLDKTEANLRAFIKRSAMPWPQHFDGKGWSNEIAGQFDISSIPATFLIGKDGKVVATNLRGAALDAEVAKALKAE